MIFHLLPHDKFNDRIINLFEKAYPEQNYFITYGSLNPKLFDQNKYKNSPIKLKQLDSCDESILINLFKKFNCSHLILHSMRKFVLPIVRKTPANITLIWGLWGFEFYQNTYLWRQPYMGSATVRLLRNNNSVYENLKLNLNKYIFSFVPSIFTLKLVKSIRKVDYLLCTIVDDYNNLKQRLNLDIKLFHLSYYSYEDYQINDSFKSESDNLIIQIGNSASYSNNHLEVFEKLKPILNSSKQGFKIICPLSYGDSKYKDSIKKEGEALFKDSFEALTEFLEPFQYNQIQKNIDVLIVNHYRQQSVGNIFAALIFGKKVFMSQLSPVFSFLKSIRIHVFSIDENLNALNDFSPLNKKQIEDNRRILKSLISRDNMIKSIRNTIKF